MSISSFTFREFCDGYKVPGKNAYWIEPVSDLTEFLDLGDTLLKVVTTKEKLTSHDIDSLPHRRDSAKGILKFFAVALELDYPEAKEIVKKNFTEKSAFGKPSEEIRDSKNFLYEVDDFFKERGVDSFLDSFVFVHQSTDEHFSFEEISGSFRSKSSIKVSANKMFKLDSLNSILEGVAGCGKTYYLEQILSNENSPENDRLSFSSENSEVVVFHPSTSYEDFVSGLRPQKDGSFKGQAGVFVDLCNRAAGSPDEDFLLFIDEINRANTAKVFGDLLMVIEESKRTAVKELEKYGRAVLTRNEAKELTHTVRLQTPVELGDEAYDYLAVPDNLYIIGTMNSTDRSVGTIDLALRRRFTWQTMEPMTATELTEALGEESAQLSDVISWYAEANEKLEEEVGPDARLGHSYFFGGKTAEQVSHDLLKQLAEIADMFHLEDLMDAEPFNRSVEGRKVIVKGKGLGRRPVVVQIEDTAQATESEPDNEPNADGAGE